VANKIWETKDTPGADDNVHFGGQGLVPKALVDDVSLENKLGCLNIELSLAIAMSLSSQKPLA
jgi:hypothetical protein